MAQIELGRDDCNFRVRPAFFAKDCLGHDAPHSLRRDKPRPVSGVGRVGRLDGGKWSLPGHQLRTWCAQQTTNGQGGGSEMSERPMSDELDGLDATEKAGIGGALNRCRVLAAKIANELRNKRPEHFVDKLSLADIHA